MKNNQDKKKEDHINNILNKYLNDEGEIEDKVYEVHPRGQNLSNINKGYNKLRKHSGIICEYNDDKISENNDIEREKSPIPKQSRRSSMTKSTTGNNTNLRKTTKRRESIVKDLCNNEEAKLGNFLEGELISQINILKQEIESLKTDKENLIEANSINRELLSQKNQEIEILNEKLKLMKEVVKKTENDIYQTKKNYSSNYNSQSISNIDSSEKNKNEKTIQELNSVKQQNLDLFTEKEILTVKAEELQKLNSDLRNTNEGLNNQMNSYKQKYTLEITELLNKLNELEREKLTLELKIKEMEKGNLNQKDLGNLLNMSTSSNKESFNLNKSINSISIDKDFAQGGSKSKSILVTMKNEIKTLLKKNDDDKLIFENTINLINEELKIKEEKIMELTQCLKKFDIENSTLKEKLQNMEKDYFTNINQTKDYWNIGDNAALTFEKLKEISSMKIDLETKVNILIQELNLTKSENEGLKQVIERHKKMEIALKNEMQLKEDEMLKRSEIIKQLQAELSNLNDENMLIKKENLTLKSKLELSETELITKYEYDLNAKNHEIFILNEKNSNFKKTLDNLKEKLTKRENIIKLKKLAHLTLAEVIKSKRNEVKCLEAMQYMNSAGMKENIKKIRDNENELLTQLEEYSNNPDFTDSDEEDYSETEDNNDFDSDGGD